MDAKSERLMKYRVGLNLFNRHPDIGIQFLINNGFIHLAKHDSLTSAVAHFLIVRQGLSKQRIAEYLLDHEKAVCMMTLVVFMNEVNFSGLTIDDAVRRLMQLIKLPPNMDMRLLVDSFADRYMACNSGQDDCRSVRSETDSGLVLPPSTPTNSLPRHESIFPRKKSSLLSRNECVIITSLILRMMSDPMTKREFLQRIKDELGHETTDQQVEKVYERILVNPIISGKDHTDIVKEIETSIRLGSYASSDMLVLHSPASIDRQFVLRHPIRCIDGRSWQNLDPVLMTYNRELFIFNDLILITVPIPKTRGDKTQYYQFCSMCLLLGLQVRKTTITSYTGNAVFGVEVIRTTDQHVFMALVARSQEDRDRVFAALHESILENSLTLASA